MLTLADASVGGKHGGFQLGEKPVNCWELYSSVGIVLVLVILVGFPHVISLVDGHVVEAGKNVRKGDGVNSGCSGDGGGSGGGHYGSGSAGGGGGGRLDGGRCCSSGWLIGECRWF